MDINFLDKKKVEEEKDKKKKSEPIKNNAKKNKNSGFFNFFAIKKDKNLMPSNLNKQRKSALKYIKDEKKVQPKISIFSTVKNNLINKHFPKLKKTKQNFYKNTIDDLKIDENNNSKGVKINYSGSESPKEKKQKKTHNLDKTEDKKWEGLNTLNTNLIKDEFYIYIDWQRNVIYLIIGILISSIMLSGGYFSLNYIEEAKDNGDIEYNKEKLELKEKIAEAEQEINKIEDFGVKIKTVKEVLNSHVYWNNFFAFLEKNTLPNVYYSSFSGDTSGIYNLSARTDDFNSLYAQVSQLKNTPGVLEAKTEAGSRFIDEEANKSRVNFNLSLKIDPKIFYQ